MNTSHTIKIKSTQAGILLKMEGLALLIGALVFYDAYGGSWLLFAALLLSFDLSMVGYLINTRWGSITYNAGHSTISPALLAILSVTQDWSLGISIAIIWFAHIGLDRMLGFGLKYAGSFKETHLNRV